ECPDLQLLKQIGGRKQRRAAEALQRVGRPGDQDCDDEKCGDEDRPVVARQRQVRGYRGHLKSSNVFLTRNIRSAPMLTAARRMSPSNRGWSSGAISKIRKKKEITRRMSAPKIEPIAPPVPPRSDVPPITTEAIE